MPAERPQDVRLETDGVLVRPIGGQIYLVEEDDELQASSPTEEAASGHSPLFGLVNRH